MFNVSAIEFAKMNATAHEVSRHFGSHWANPNPLILTLTLIPHANPNLNPTRSVGTLASTGGASIC